MSCLLGIGLGGPPNWGLGWQAELRCATDMTSGTLPSQAQPNPCPGLCPGHAVLPPSSTPTPTPPCHFHFPSTSLTSTGGSMYSYMHALLASGSCDGACWDPRGYWCQMAVNMYTVAGTWWRQCIPGACRHAAGGYQRNALAPPGTCYSVHVHRHLAPVPSRVPASAVTRPRWGAGGNLPGARGRALGQAWVRL
jgi:hypothetical protein